MSIFKFLFGKPLMDHQAYIFIYSFLLLIYVGLGSLFATAGFPWHFLLVWIVLFPILVRIEHAIVRRIYRGWKNAPQRRPIVKTIGGVVGAMFLNIIAMVALILYVSYYAPNGSFVFNYKQSQVNNVYEVSAGLLRGTQDTGLYVSIPAQDPDLSFYAPYEAWVGEGAFTIEFYDKKSGDVVWSKEVTYNVRGTIEIPAVGGKYYLRLVAGEQAKGMKFKVRLE